MTARQPPLRFLYKIWSGYDGFTPPRIPQRLDRRDRLTLGWAHYIDLLEPGAEVWVYFYGPHRFEPGVYVKGTVREINVRRSQVYLGIGEYATNAPLTDAATNSQVAEAAAQRGRQVFFLPDALLRPVADCTLAGCRARHCDRCPRWRAVPLIRVQDLRRPSRLPDALADFVPAYWVVPPRCFLWYEGAVVARAVQAGSQMFYEFKAGEARRAYPLARAMFDALRQRGQLDFDGVVPIPLSPDKVESGELHRTLELARELGRLLGAPVKRLLTLTGPISKRRLRNAGVSVGEFERRYRELLAVSADAGRYERLLLVDDVCDHGSTFRVAAATLQSTNAALQLTASAAGQMIIKEAVRDRALLVA